MIKTAHLFRYSMAPTVPRLAPFVPCTPTQSKASGWVAPRGEAHGAPTETIDGRHVLMRFQVETRRVPGEALRRHTENLVASAEQESGRKMGKKMRREFREIAESELLPKAFSTVKTAFVWFDTKTGILAIEGLVDEVISALIVAIDGLKLAYLNTAVSPAVSITRWLHEGAPGCVGFELGRSCALKATNETRAVVTYDRHELDLAQIRDHVDAGKVCESLGLVWRGRVDFTLDRNGALRKIHFLDVVFEGRKDQAADAFDANAAICCGELSALTSDLVAALGGETESLT